MKSSKKNSFVSYKDRNLRRYIYENHIDVIKEQISRLDTALKIEEPKLGINSNIKDFL